MIKLDSLIFKNTMIYQYIYRSLACTDIFEIAILNSFQIIYQLYYRNTITKNSIIHLLVYQNY